VWVSLGEGAVDFSPPDKMACESIRLLEEVTPEWSLLPIYPVVRALLYSSWLVAHPEAKAEDRPAWADLSGADLSGAYLGGANQLVLPLGWKLDANGYAERTS